MSDSRERRPDRDYRGRDYYRDRERREYSSRRDRDYYDSREYRDHHRRSPRHHREKPRYYNDHYSGAKDAMAAGGLGRSSSTMRPGAGAPGMNPERGFYINKGDLLAESATGSNIKREAADEVEEGQI